MVKNWLTSRGEKLVYFSPDGVKYDLHDPAKRAVISTTGWGMPAVEIAAARGPYQHGFNLLDIRLGMRTITVNIRGNGCSRNEYWSNRAGLLDVLRHNRTNLDNPIAGSLRWYRSDGTKRQVDVLVQAGPTFDKTVDGWDEFSYLDTITFAAYNPILYNPSRQLGAATGLGCTFETDLTFPFYFALDTIVFGIPFCATETLLSVNYAGNWTEFPYIVAYGPMKNFSILHNQTGLRLALENEYTIPAGTSAIFDLSYGRKTITLASTGVSLLGRLSTDSDLGSFALEPAPDVAGGINTFTIYAEEADTNSQVQILYYARYMGI